MSTHIERSGDLLTIEQAVPLPARLMTLPLLLVSGYFLHILFLSVSDVFAGTKESELLTGQILCLVISLLAGLPGLIGLVIRNQILIDLAQAKVTNVHLLGLCRIARSFDLSRASLITMTWEDMTGQNTTGPGYDLFRVKMLNRKQHKSTTVASFYTHKEAVDFAGELSVALRLPFKDLSGTEPEENDERCAEELAATPANQPFRDASPGSPRRTNIQRRPSIRPRVSAPAHP